MKFKIGDLAVFKPRGEPNLDPLDFGAYWALVAQYTRPITIDELDNLGIVIDSYQSSRIFLKTNKNHNMYVWISQQTQKQYIVFELELTKPATCAKMASYQDSFIGSPFKKSRKSKVSK